MLDLSETIASDQFAQLARHPDHPKAFTRCRKLPLPALVGALLFMRASSQQALLDGFFGTLCAEGALLREVSDRAFARARARLHMPSLVWLNHRLIELAEAAAMVPRWQGFRLVAGDASVLMPALRLCHRTRSTAGADQRLFALYLPGPELTLHAAVHSAAESERAMLAQALDKLQPGDLLLLWAPARTCGDLAGFKLLTGLGGHSAQLAVERGRPWLGAQGSIWSLVRKLRPSMGTVSA